MKKFFSALLTGFAIFFSIPTVLILASWNALPGQVLYSVKSSLEDVALALTINTPLSTAFSVSFTGRRFAEATKLQDKEGSTAGYELLVAEAQQAQGMVIGKQDVKSGTQLIRKIEEYQAEIAERQISAQDKVSAPSTGYQVPSPTPVIPPSPATPVPVVTKKKKTTVVIPIEIVIEEEEPEVIIENLKETQLELEKIKEKIKEKLPDAASQKAKDQHGHTDAEEETHEDAKNNDKNNKDYKPKNQENHKSR